MNGASVNVIPLDHSTVHSRLPHRSFPSLFSRSLFGYLNASKECLKPSEFTWLGSPVLDYMVGNQHVYQGVVQVRLIPKERKQAEPSQVVSVS